MNISHCLVTGADGYIGSRLCPYLAGTGFIVWPIDIGYYKACEFSSRPEIKHGWMSRTKHDVRVLNEDDLKYYDAVVHLAALSNDPLGMLDPKATKEINTDATIRLAQIAKEAGVKRFIFSSSCSVYGGQGAKEVGVDENGELAPLTAYAQSKVEAEAGLKGLASDDFHVIVLRNATVYGAAPMMRTDLVVNNLVGSAMLYNQIRLNSDGTAWRPMLHVRDLCEVIDYMLRVNLRDQPPYLCFNVGSNESNFTINEMAKAVSEVMGCNIVYGSGASKDSRSYKVDFTKLREFMDTPLSVSLRVGIRELVTFYSSNLLTEHDFTKRLVRMEWLKKRVSEGLRL